MTSSAKNSMVVLLIAGRPVGSGFLVHESGLLATCEHLVNELQIAHREEFEFRTLEDETGRAIVTKHQDAANDAALLQINGKLPGKLVPVTLIKSDSAQGIAFIMMGYAEVPDSKHSYKFYPTGGTVEGVVSRDEVKLLKLKCEDLFEGMSGSAIYCPDLGGVVGMQIERLSIDPKGERVGANTGFACISEAIADFLPELRMNKPKRVELISSITFGNIAATGSILVQNNYLGNIGIKAEWRRPAESARGFDWRNAIPREEELKRLADRLEPDQTTRLYVIWGMPGTGKTTLAAQFVDQYGERFQGGVLWEELGANFVPERSVPDILRRWANYLYPGLSDLSGQKQQRLKVQAEDLNQGFGANGHMLFVFDDVADYGHIDLLSEAIPASASILVISHIGPEGTHIEQFPSHRQIGPLSEVEGMSLLKQRVPALSEDVRRRLANKFGYPAQALVLVSNDLRQRLKPQEYAHELLQERTQKASLEPILLALESSYEALSGEDQRSFFRMLGALRDFDVNVDFSTDLAVALWGESYSSAQRILESLRNKALVSKQDTDRWSMERLVRNYAQELLLQEPTEYDRTLVRCRTYIIELARGTDVWANGSRDIPLLLSAGGVLVEEAARQLSPSSDRQPKSLTDVVTFVRSAFSFFSRGAGIDALALRWLDVYVSIGKALGDREVEVEGLHVKAQLCLAQDSTTEAIKLFQRERQVAEIGGNIRFKALALFGEGNALALQGREPKSAIARFQEALELLDKQDAPDSELQLYLLTGLSSAYLNISEVQNAHDALTQAAKLHAKLASDPDISLRIEQQLGVLDLYQGKPEKALQRFVKAREEAGLGNDKRTLAQLTLQIGIAYMHSGNHPQAEEHFSQVLETSRQIPDARLRSHVLTEYSRLNISQGNLDDAHKQAEQALDLAIAQKDETLQARVRALLGDLLDKRGRSDDALQELQASFALMSKVEDTTTAVYVLNTMGAIYQKTKRTEEGIEFLSKALDELATRNNAGAKSSILNWLSMLMSEVGNFPEAMRFFEQAQPLIDRLDNKEEKATVLAVQGVVYMNMGLFDKAYDVVHEAEQIWRAMNDSVRRSETLLLMAQINLGQQRLDEAQGHIEKIEELDRSLQNSPILSNTPMAVAYFNLKAMLHMSANELEPAEMELDHSRQVNEQIKDPEQRIVNVLYRGLLYIAQGNFDPAREYLQSALKEVEDYGSIPYMATIYATLGRLHYLRGDPADAADALENAARILEESGIESDSENRSAPMFRSVADVLRSTGSQGLLEESLQMLLNTGNWEEIRYLLQALNNTLLDSQADLILALTIEEAAHASNTLLERVLVCYQQILSLCRDKGINAINDAHQEVDTGMLVHWWAYKKRVQQNYRAALAHIDRVLSLDPNDIDALIERAWINRGLGRFDQALIDFDQVRRLSPSDYRAYQGRGVIEFERGEMSTAIASLTTAIQKNEKDAYNFQWRSAVYQMQNERKLALDDIDKAVDLDPDSGDHYYWRALLLLDDEKPGPAKDDLTKAIRCDKRQETHRSLYLDYFWRGIAQDLLHQNPGAHADWIETKKFIDENPQDWSAPLYNVTVENNTEDATRQYEALMKQSYVPHHLAEQMRHLRMLERLYPERTVFSDLRKVLESNLGKT
jgi:tetratricopeptide (TPR) repeat protein